MRAPLLPLFVLLALFATLAWAEETQEENLIAKMRLFTQEASQRAQEHLATLQESEVAQKAREWLDSSITWSKEYFTELRERFSSLWETKA
uniref:Apolipoprotein C-III n=1 Tax=Pogona vitticeps TaxID=103695 RepID=A0A6J0TMK5_9SAUR